MYEPEDKELIKQLEKEELESRESIIDFYEDELSLEVFQAMLFKPFHHQLAPLVYFEM
jgi:hypothetical protein